ncbi:hypothetical protein EVJ58_g9165 [Rhodofomes roseus]|uniref:BTB domain-containing protein n=1 Tax=Rhodofomes roseus TaxID=34475 RepID=A0A4Y9XUU9_9APHY|nr:hypothetical protein EVJ58_g9165 [Rhodofomes roseus]
MTRRSGVDRTFSRIDSELELSFTAKLVNSGLHPYIDSAALTMSSSSSGADTKTSQSSRKRPRTEPDSVDDANESFRRDETYWYDDGNIIFVAQNVGFRVYKGILAAKCEVFRDMFSLPQPAQESGPGGSRDTVLYGCPVVHVTDTAGEFRMLLDSLLNGME